MRGRRKIVVKPREQIRVGIFVFVLLLFISSALLWSFFYYTLSLIEESISPQNARILYPLKEKILGMAKWEFTLLILASLLVGAGSGIIFSHAFLGPIHRLEKILEEWDGKTPLKEIKFRKSDLTHSLARAFNTAIKKCQNDKSSTH